MFAPEGPVDTQPELVQVMAWHQTGAKPLPVPIMAKSTDTYKYITRF